MFLSFEQLLNMDNPVFVAIKERRSIRQYTDKHVSSEMLELIIHAGKYAPSAENRQPWKFIVVTDRNTIQSLSEQTKQEIGSVLKHKWKWKRAFPELNDKRTALFLSAVSQSSSDEIFHDAPVLVFLITTGEIFNDESCACAAQNMMLAAWSLGLGSCWIGFAKFLEIDTNVIANLGVPEEYHIAAALTFGYPQKTTQRAPIRKPTATIIKWIEGQ